MLLEKIIEIKRKEVLQIQTQTSLPPLRSFRQALAAEGLSLIAEIKRSSPSRGQLRPNLDPHAWAQTYQANGARALSVLTDRTFFSGSLHDLARARQATHLPALRKDFIIHPQQVHEARAWGADAILLIVRILDEPLLQDLLCLTSELGMDALVEVHTVEEIDRALKAGAQIIGVNNRDLATLHMETSRCRRLAPYIPPGVLKVAESGIYSKEDLEGLDGYDAILVGEAIISSADPAAKVRELSRGVVRVPD